MREVAAALSGMGLICLDCCKFHQFIGMKLTKAYAYLGDVKDHKRVIPFRRFAGGVGRASQAKEFKATQGVFKEFESAFLFIHLRISGRWPEKSVKFITRLLKNAESNADAKNIDVEDLYIRNIVVEQAPVRIETSGHR